jgi:catechol 2,3-dioxygenase-like lactoylglutathione lyase family enzyme
MTSTDTANTAATPIPEHGEMHLEVVVLPVSDVERAKQFYVDTCGFRLDGDFPGPDGLRIVQVTPPGSNCSVSFGEDVTTATPGSTQDLTLALCDNSFASFSDPDGNGWMLQEITTRLPGR